MQLAFDSDVEEFRAEFSAFLDEHTPSAAETLERPRSVSHMPQWARDFQRLLFDNGWLLPAQPPEFGGRNATVLQTFVHAEELCRRRIYHSFNPQGVNIIAASLLTFGTDEQKHQWAVPVLRGEPRFAARWWAQGAAQRLWQTRGRWTVATQRKQRPQARWWRWSQRRFLR